MKWTSQQKSILSTVALTSFLNPFLISSVNIALPAIEQEFSMNAVLLSWIITTYLLSSAILLLPMGRWADITGIKKIFRIGLFIFSLTTLACGFAPSGFFLLAFRLLQGIGGAMTMTTGPAILVSGFSPKERGKVLGISVASVYMGLAVGPFAGGILTQQLGWRSIFIVSALFGLAASVVALIFLGKDTATNQPKKVNLTGSLIYAMALMAMVIGSSQIPDGRGWLLLGTGLLLLVLFVFIEKQVRFPVIDLRLFARNKLFAFSNMAALINYSATFAIVFLLSLYLQKIKSLSPQEAGTILLFQPLMMALLSPLTGKLSDKIQPRILATTGMALTAVGLLFFAFLGEATAITPIVLNLILVGTGFALFSSPNMNTIMSSVEKHQYGVASGVSATMRVVGQMVSMTIVTLFFALYIGETQISLVADDLFMASLQWTFIAFSALAFIGIGFSYNRGNIERP
jgi:EmrB/QacA subfamily drug resistance transporter